MGLVPLGVSGNSGSNGNIDLSNANTIVAPGAVYELSRWVGHTLRHLSFTLWCGSYFPTGAIAITNRLPQSLHPKDLDPQALFTILLNPYAVGYVGSYIFDFPPGLIWVGPGESLYVVVYDLVHSNPNAENTAQWTLNMLWEPYGR
jgi:hypothetical protein